MPRIIARHIGPVILKIERSPGPPPHKIPHPAPPDDPAGPLLQVRDLRTWFPIRKGLFQSTVGHVKAVDGVSFSVAPGKTLGLVGESGCGKTTVGRTILRLIPATSGEVKIGEFDAGDPHTRDKVHLALVFQAGALFNSLSVYDNLALYPREHRLGSEREIHERQNNVLREGEFEMKTGMSMREYQKILTLPSKRMSILNSSFDRKRRERGKSFADLPSDQE